MRLTARVAGAAIGIGLVLGGCAIPEPPGAMPTNFIPTPSLSDFDPSRGHLSPDGFDAAQRMAVRVRNIGCGAILTGSGFAIDSHTLVTNRHVVSNSSQLELNTYDGRDVEVTAAQSAILADLAIVRTETALPAHPKLADRDPQVGEEITIIGYPKGGQLELSTGVILGTVPDPLEEHDDPVFVTDALVERGSSGSAVLDADGQVIGVVYAKNSAGQTFLVPASTLRALLNSDDGFEPSPVCENPTLPNTLTPIPTLDPSHMPTPLTPHTPGMG